MITTNLPATVRHSDAEAQRFISELTDLRATVVKLMAELRMRKELEREFIYQHNNVCMKTNEQGTLIRHKAESIARAFRVASTLVPAEHRETVLALTPDLIPPTVLKKKIRSDYFDHKILIMTSELLSGNREQMLYDAADN